MESLAKDPVTLGKILDLDDEYAEASYNDEERESEDENNIIDWDHKSESDISDEDVKAAVSGSKYKP